MLFTLVVDKNKKIKNKNKNVKHKYKSGQLQLSDYKLLVLFISLCVAKSEQFILHVEVILMSLPRSLS